MNVVIIGAGGHGKVVLDILQHNRDLTLIGFIDDDINSHHKTIEGVAVLGDVDSLSTLVPACNLESAIAAVGDNKTRAGLYEKIKKLGLKMINAVHPDALIAKDVKIGEGVVIAAGAIINTGTRIGNNVIINTGVIIDHDNIIEDHAHISPGVNLAGRVTVKKYAHVGLGVTVESEKTIGENATVGAGAVVLEDISDNAISVGVPAKVIRYKEPTTPAGLK